MKRRMSFKLLRRFDIYNVTCSILSGMLHSLLLGGEIMIRIAKIKDLETVLQITDSTISEIYSHYYAEGVVSFFFGTSQQRKYFIGY